MADLAPFMARADDVRKRAMAFPKRRSDAQLYGLLADCMRLVQTCEREGLLDQLKAEVIRRNKAAGAKRAYFEASADASLVVGRFMFSDGVGRRTDAAWRYTATIREAAKRQIAPDDLAQWLNDNGGINALFKARDVDRRDRETSTLHLTRKVTMSKTKPITLTLQDNGAGFYDVIKVHTDG